MEFIKTQNMQPVLILLSDYGHVEQLANANLEVVVFQWSEWFCGQ